MVKVLLRCSFGAVATEAATTPRVRPAKRRRAGLLLKAIPRPRRPRTRGAVSNAANSSNAPISASPEFLNQSTILDSHCTSSSVHRSLTSSVPEGSPVASIKDIVFDSPHPASAARFWAQALHDYEIAPYDEEELARLRSVGINDPEDDPSVLLVATDGSLPRIIFQLVPEGKRVKNRVHLDLSAIDAVAEVKRLCALGATVQAEREDWTTMQDPDGNEFCLMRS